MECELCKLAYTPTERLPKMLPGCGHTFCSICLASRLTAGSIVCPDCGKKGTHPSVQSLPTNQVLLNLSGSPGKVCSTHGKNLEAFSPETLSLLCVDCLLSKQYKGKVVKSIDEAYKEALETVNRDTKSCEEIVEKAQMYLGQHATMRDALDYSKSDQIKALDGLYGLIMTAVEKWRQASQSRIDMTFIQKKQSLEDMMRDLKNCQVDASDLEQDRYLDKVDLLKKTKIRRETLVACRKTLATSEAKRSTFDLGEFHSRSELDSLITELRNQFEQASRPGTSSKSTPNGTANNNGSVNKPASKPNTVNYYKPNQKTDIPTTPTIHKKTPGPTNAASRPKTSGPATTIQAAGPTSLADKRNEMKMLKVQGTPTPQQSAGSKPPASATTSTKPASPNSAPGYASGQDPQPSPSPPKPSPSVVKPQTKDGHPPVSPHSTPNQLTSPKGDKKKGDKPKKEKRDKKGGADVDPEHRVVAAAEYSNLHMADIDDQKISLFQDTLIEGHSTHHNKWDKRKATGPDTTNLLDNLKNVPTNRSPVHDESHFTISPELGLTVGERFHLSNSKDTIYDIGNYLDGSYFGDPAFESVKPQILVSEQIAPHNNPASNAWKKNGDRPANSPTFGGQGFDKVYESVLSDPSQPPQAKPSAGKGRPPGLRDKLICLGGYNQDKKMNVEVYDPASKAWRLVEFMEETRSQFGAISLTMNSILLFGGLMPNGLATDQSVQFNLTTMSFSPHPFRLTQPKCMFGYAYIAPKLYIIGGASNLNISGVLSDCEEYDMISGEIRTLSRLPIPRAECACAYQGNAIYIVGGLGPSGNSLKSVTKYDTIKGTWEELPEMLIARRGMRAEIVQGSLFVFGGYDGEKFLCSIERYNAAEKMWNQMKFIPNGRFGHYSVVGNSGDRER